ncbi:unnamed protein product [Chondrus crispus]|uniref:C2 domain-containing protein n=1 Tax=Chondrus crispus TaxID=2769 RepID=R7QRB4_CHOCR|nr:unnamed protein product [Chondrus crispus]CDF40303.1 unnamed protein product [Chondrus crispus]|eukprot:XP_005710597.1 unnamed protein product [Chondrus crispus]
MPEGPADPYDKGVAFRGRVLIGVGAKPGNVEKPFLRPCPPPPRPKLEFYKMEFSVLRATELPLLDGWSVSVRGRIGLYEFGTTIPNAVVQNCCVIWDEKCAVSIPNMQFPEDVEQIPDFFVTISARKPSTVEELEEKQAAEGRRATIDPDGNRSADEALGNTEYGTIAEPAERVSITEKNKEFLHNPLDAGGFDASNLPKADDPATRRTPSHIPDSSVEKGSSNSFWTATAFLRLPAKHLICGQKDPRWLFMDYPGNNVLDSGDNKVPGSILMSASLSRYDPIQQQQQQAAGEDRTTTAPQNVSSTTLDIEKRSSLKKKTAPSPTASKQVVIDEEQEAELVDASDGTKISPGVGDTSRRGRDTSLVARATTRSDSVVKPHTYSIPLGYERSYTLRALILQGRNLPAADETGLSDPRVVVSMGDKSEYGQVFCKQTVSPSWEELIEVKDIKIRDGERKPNVNILIYDYDGEDIPMAYLGRSIIPCAELDSAPPTLEHSEWYPVFSVNPGVIVGEVLADFQLIPSEFAIAHPMRPFDPPDRTESGLRISLVGLRDVKFLQYAAGDIFVECAVSSDSVKPVRSKRGTILQRRAFEANCNILDVLVLEIKVPEDLRLAPALSVYVYAEYNQSHAPDMIATAVIPLEKWLFEHHRKLLTGESLIDDSFGTDALVPERLHASSNNYKFRRNARLAGEEPVGASLRLHEVKSQERGERKNIIVLQENKDILRVGFSAKDETSKVKKAVAEGNALGDKVFSMLAPLRAMKYQIADTLADLMPDVSMALGVEVDEDVPLSALLGGEEDKIDYDGTMYLKKDRGYCPKELESDFSEPAYGEFLMFRGDNRSLGNTIGRIADAAQMAQGNQAFPPPILPLEELTSTASLLKKEKRRAALEGARPAVGKLKARLDLVEMDKKDDLAAKMVRFTSLRSFGRVFIPTEVVVRVYILRGINLQQVGSQCNPYLTAKFYGGYPDYHTQKHEPIEDDDNPNFFDMFESRVKMPGGSVRIEVKDRVLPEVTVPLSYPMYLKDEGKARFGIKHTDVPVNIGKLGFGWSAPIGETVIDLDARWYNSSWRYLARTPVERRSLYSDGSANLKGQLECFVDIFDAKDVDKRPKLYRPVPISRPPQELYELRLVVYKIQECTLPYKLRGNDPNVLAAFYVQARLGNKPEHEKKTPPCKYVADGIAEFNWRMKWNINLPSLDIKPRLKLQVFDDTSHGLGDDQLCATVDIKLRSLFDDLVVNKKPIIKKKQWLWMEHPNYPDVQSQIQVSLELTTKQAAAKKKCFSGNDGYKDTQHQDYVLPPPFQPAAFSLYNPVPYFNYLIISSIKNLQWQLATVLLIFPFMPMFVQFVFMLTPWQWYAAGGVSGLLVFIRLLLVDSARATRLHAEQQAAKVVIEEEEEEEE